MRQNRTKQYYEKNGAAWAAKKTNSFYHEKQFTRFCSFLKPRAHVLDIGCASGIHVPMFFGIGRKLRYTGLDITNAFLKVARRRYPQLTFIQGDIGDKRTLPKKKFDAFLALSVLMHISLEEWPTMFKNIESITKPGAIGYLSFPVGHPSGADVENDSRHFTILSEKKQRETLEARGWKILARGKMDGFTQKNVWRWYIVRLP